MAATLVYDVMSAEAVAAANPTWKVKLSWTATTLPGGKVLRTRGYLHADCIMKSSRVRFVFDNKDKDPEFSIGARIGVGAGPINCLHCNKAIR